MPRGQLFSLKAARLFLTDSCAQLHGELYLQCIFWAGDTKKVLQEPEQLVGAEEHPACGANTQREDYNFN